VGGLVGPLVFPLGGPAPGSGIVTPGLSWWGQWFPEGGPLSWWRGWFPDSSYTVDPGLPPAGAAAFVLAENVTVTLGWRSGLFKSWSGLERRSNLKDDPAQFYDGSALLVGRDSRATRSRLARYAALGLPFSLGLAYESAAIIADSTGTTVHVSTTARLDWAVVGGRVLVRRFTGTVYDNVETVIAAVTATTIEVTATLGSVGARGAEIMPTMAVYLDARQGFARYTPAEPVERWSLKARAAIAGFASAPQYASLPLLGITTSGNLDGMTLRARVAGAAPITVTQSDDALTSGGELVEDADAGTLHIKYMGDISTVAQYVALINAGSALVYVDGTYDGAEVVNASDDEFPATAMTGGADSTPAEVGRGATVTEYAGRPIWDRGIDVEGTAGDSMQAFCEPQDLGGLPFLASEATYPDWGRNVQISSTVRSEFQWLKRFLWEVAGRWRTWWLPTFRADLLPVSVGAGTLTVQGGEDAGDFHAWWPTLQQHVMVRVNGALSYVRISAAAASGANIVLSIVDEDDDPVTLAGVPDLVSWLERVRFEDDALTIGFKGVGFAFQSVARVMQEPSVLAATSDTFLDAERERESTVREGIEIILPAVTYRIASGTRDVSIDGETFTASPAGRDEVGVASATEENALIVTLPLSHAAIVRYLRGGIPPRQMFVNLWRRHGTDDAETLWRGQVTSIAADTGAHVAKLRVVSSAFVQARRRLPTVTVGRGCPHILYAANTCRVSRASFVVAATVASYNGRVVTLSTVGGNPSQWARGGELVHVASGERMTVQDQTGLDVTCQAQIQELALGDAVELYAGCDHSVAACRDKFSNMANYGGFPQLETEKPFQPGAGFGVSVQP
jgi:uncharacterized phage protein (TIGR02218 family)